MKGGGAEASWPSWPSPDSYTCQESKEVNWVQFSWHNNQVKKRIGSHFHDTTINSTVIAELGEGDASKYWLCIDAKYLQFLLFSYFIVHKSHIFHVLAELFLSFFWVYNLQHLLSDFSFCVSFCMCACTTHVCVCIDEAFGLFAVHFLNN